MERDYASACNKKVNARTKEEWENAAKLFAACGEYKNSKELAKECQKQAAQVVENGSGWKFM